MAGNTWRERCAAINLSAREEGFDIAAFARKSKVLDPHGRHEGFRFEALVPMHKADTRVEDVQIPLSRGDWVRPTELCDASNVARRRLLSEIVNREGDPVSQMAILAAAFVYTHMTNDNRRRYAWPIPASEILVDLAMNHLKASGIHMTLPALGTYALIGTAHMCRSAPEPLCDNNDKLDRSVGRHIAISFRETCLLSILIEKGGVSHKSSVTPATRSLLSLSKEQIQALLAEKGIEDISDQYGMKQRDVAMAFRRRGITIPKAA